MPPPPPEQRGDAPPDPERQYKLLRMTMAEREGFRFLLVSYNGDAVRDSTLARLTTDLDAAGVDHLVLDLRTLPEQIMLLQSVMDLLRDTPERPGRRRAVSVIGLERHLPYRFGGTRSTPTDLLATANFQRDAFPLRVPMPMALWATRLAQPAIAHTAPDLWHWRVGLYDLTGTAAQTDLATLLEQAIPRPEQDWQRQPKPEADRRRALLESLIAELPEEEDPNRLKKRMLLLHELGSLLIDQGEPQAAEVRLEAAAALADRIGDVREKALIRGRIADILRAHGDLDSALRIRETEELPVYEKLGDIRSAAVIRGKIADILQARGDLDGALRIRKAEELPVYEKLGDVRATAITHGKVADILQIRGELAAALRIRKTKVLPVFEKLGDIREAAITRGKIADIFADQGKFDAALRIRETDLLPVFEKLGDVREVAICHGKIADILRIRGDRDAALRILEFKVLPVVKKLGDIRLDAIVRGRIADILMDCGELGAALHIRETKELPIYEKLGDIRSASMARMYIASLLLRRDAAGDRWRAGALLRDSLAAFRRMRLPEAATVERIMLRHGFPVPPAENGDADGDGPADRNGTNRRSD